MHLQQSIWEATTERTSFPALSGDAVADVVIVGAGITGLTAAILLKRAGQQVVVLEKGRVGSGTSGLTTAHASTLWDHGYLELGKKYGAEAASRVARCMQLGIELIERLQSELAIDCDFERLPAYDYAEPGQSEAAVKREFDAARAAGLPVSLTEKVPLPFPVRVGFMVQDQAQLHALRYLDGLAKAVHGDGSIICENTRVLSFSDDSREVRTTSGRVRAGRILLATHTPLGLSPLHAELSPQRSFVLAAKVHDTLPRALFWDAAEPYHYLRTHTIGDQTWLIAGGYDRKTAHGEEPASIQALRQYVHDRFDVIEIGFEWAAQLYEPSDHLPFIGRSPLSKNTFVATGFSGDGISFGSAAGVILKDLLTGVENEHAHLFRPERLHLIKAFPKLVKENADVVKSFVWDRVTGNKVEEEIAKLARNEGRVVGRGLGKIAAYRDEHGTVTRMSAVCPHMKCIVRWNEAKSTFDCPCHGSRFSCDGSVIEGPALEGLKKIEPESEEESDADGGL